MNIQTIPMDEMVLVFVSVQAQRQRMIRVRGRLPAGSLTAARFPPADDCKFVSAEIITAKPSRRPRCFCCTPDLFLREMGYRRKCRPPFAQRYGCMAEPPVFLLSDILR